jgi:hypothetical protein
MCGWVSCNQTEQFVTHKGETIMKKLMTLALGLAFVLGTVPVSFAQENPPKTEKKKKTSKKKADKKTEEKK